MMARAAIATMLTAGVAQGVFPGAVHAVGMPDGSMRQRAFGFHQYDAHTPAVTIDTLYDWASLTKIVCATAALRLIATGRMALHEPVAQYVPTRATAVTIAHLLTHTAGLDVRLSTVAQQGADALWQTVLTTLPSCPPGTQVAYANVNSLLLGRVISAVTGLVLADALRALVLEPAQMLQTQFNPPMTLWPQIPPTERDPIRGVVHGTVHDESTAVLGGVSGHAGLFGPVGDAIRFGQGWLATLTGTSPWGIPRALAQTAVTNQSPTGQLGCGLGWMVARDTFMGVAVDATAAHTGFTGPVVAIVPVRGYCWALLSNRTWPVRTPARHHVISAQVSSALWQANDGFEEVLDGYTTNR